MAVTAAMVKELREATGAGILASKQALEASDGDFDKAIELLREKGMAKAAKKANREAKDGLVAVKVNGSQACIVEVNCETDFVARTDDFKNFVNTIVEQVFNSPNLNTVDELLESNYIADSSKTVSTAIQETISKLGENIIVKRFARYAQEGPGLLEGYIHPGDRIGVLVEVSVENPDAENEALTELAHDLTLQVAAANPQYLNREAVPNELIAKERTLLLKQLEDDKKPENIKAKIVEGRLNKFYKEVCLLDQPFVKEDKLSIKKVLKENSKKVGSPITINRFTRFELGSS